jgi:hypothetical protein
MERHLTFKVWFHQKTHISLLVDFVMCTQLHFCPYGATPLWVIVVKRQFSNSYAMSWREQVDDGVDFVLDQHAKLNLQC